MKIVPVKCPDCGADIKLPEGSSSLVCEYCGGNILVTDILGSTSVMQNCMMLAFSSMERKNYKDAYDHFNRAIEIDLKNPNAWFGKAVCIGMTGKFSEDIFGKMISCFESAFNYAADKQPNLKKNAAAEIVKIVRKNKAMVHLAAELLTLGIDDDFSSQVNSEYTKIKETVVNTVQKANEYDPANKEAAALLDEVTSGRFFTPEEREMKQNPDENKPLTVEMHSPPDITDQKTSAPLSQTGNATKTGCSMVLIILMLVTCLLLEFFH